MFNTNNGYSLSDIAAASGGGRGGFGGFNDGGAWWIIILFLFCFNGGWNNGWGGGGGSGYASSTMTKISGANGNASMPAPAGSTETGHTGNGYARITLVK